MGRRTAGAGEAADAEMDAFCDEWLPAGVGILGAGTLCVRGAPESCEADDGEDVTEDAGAAEAGHCLGAAGCVGAEGACERIEAVGCVGVAVARDWIEADGGAGVVGRTAGRIPPAASGASGKGEAVRWGAMGMAGGEELDGVARGTFGAALDGVNAILAGAGCEARRVSAPAIA